MSLQVSNSLDQWTVSATVSPKGQGLGVVTIMLDNGRVGSIPAIAVTINWVPGMEAADVQAHALSLLASSATALGEALEEAARAVSIAGEPLA